MILEGRKPVDKCGVGKGAACCSFVVMHGVQFECSYIVQGPVFRALMKRQMKGEGAALAGPCSDPYDEHSKPISVEDRA